MLLEYEPVGPGKLLGPSYFGILQINRIAVIARVESCRGLVNETPGTMEYTPVRETVTFL